MMIVEFFKYLWAQWFGAKTFYGVSTDSTIELDSLPRKYPKIDDMFKITIGDVFFQVMEVRESDEKIVIIREDNQHVFEMDIELFEELFVPVAEHQNYPL